MKSPRALDPETHEPFAKPTATEKLAGFLWERYGIRVVLKAAAKISSCFLVVSGTFGYTPSAQEAIGVGLCGLFLGVLDFAIAFVVRKLGWFPVKKLQVASEEQTYGRVTPTEICDPPNIPDNKIGVNESSGFSGNFANPHPLMGDVISKYRAHQYQPTGDAFREAETLKLSEALTMVDIPTLKPVPSNSLPLKDVVPKGFWCAEYIGKDGSALRRFKTSLAMAELEAQELLALHKDVGVVNIYEPGDELPL